MNEEDKLKFLEISKAFTDANPGIRDNFYCIDENKNVLKCSLGESSIQREEGKFIIKQEMYNGIKISTVFLGMDHSFDFSGKSEPIVFETMIFGDDYQDYQTRCSTYDQALLMHEAALLTVKAGIKDDSI